jgi:hypothetical protein
MSGRVLFLTMLNPTTHVVGSWLIVVLFLTTQNPTTHVVGSWLTCCCRM